MQSDKAIRYGLLGSTIAAGIAVVLQVSAAPYQEKPLSCRMNDSMAIVDSVDATASYQLGQNYEFGEGVEKNFSRSYSWYCNGALQKHSASQLQVAMMLLEGSGVAKDVPRGMHWMNRAAQNGNHDAELALGILLVDSDPMRSAVLFKRSAASGNLYANHRLAELYYYGIGVPQDYVKAQELSELGVASGFEKSKELLTRIRVKQDSGEYVTTTPVPVAESIPKIQQPPEEEKKTEESGNLLKSILSVLPGLGESEEEVKPSEEKVVELSEEVVAAQEVEVEATQEIVENAEKVTEDEVVTEPVVNEAEYTPQVVLASPSSRLPELKKEDLVTAPETESDVSQVKLEDDLVKAAEDELKELETLSSGDLVAENANTNPVIETPVIEKEAAVVEEQVSEPKLENNPVTAAIVPQSAKFTALNQPVREESFLRGGSWVNQQPDMRYSIQLVQASQVDGIMKYIRKHDLADKAYYIHAQQDGQYRYILLYGDYPNNRTSKKVAKTLPQAVQDAGYWIRTYGDLRRSYIISD